MILKIISGKVSKAEFNSRLHLLKQATKLPASSTTHHILLLNRLRRPRTGWAFPRLIRRTFVPSSDQLIQLNLPALQTQLHPITLAYHHAPSKKRIVLCAGLTCWGKSALQINLNLLLRKTQSRQCTRTRKNIEPALLRLIWVHMVLVRTGALHRRT